MRVVFMGSDAIALPALHWLTGATGSGQAGGGHAEVVGVFTQPDRAAGRGQKVQANAIKQWAEARGLPVHQPAKFGAADQQALAALQPDLTLVMAYGHILKQDVIDTPRLGTINLHTSILPQYRGASPIQTATAQGETVTGVTLMKMVLALDAGPVGDVERVTIGLLDTAAEVEAKLSAACVPLLQRAIPALAEGSLRFTPQDEAGVSFCRRLEKTDGAVDFAASAAKLAARINGLNPWPGCSVEINGQIVKLGLAESLTNHGTNANPGTVVGHDASGLLVAAGQGDVLCVRKLQRPGGKMLPAVEFLRGFPVASGTVLPSLPMPPLVAREPFSYRKG